ncbi:glutathionylspermidine synthase family protein [Stenotrophomonas pavanii]|uniref:glutathionylspermidine synthase family protein n=1 Tax=Stenotrophomonas pavanii TaxID=487698 RepID=UPI002DBEFC0F|nr:glutathionylspermidine synthase family protein [Stenotrophomonas pavanii]MEC4339813.1 glutathionylspermidine synthase family protein [Stenotrophomonas pavanii]
MQRILISERANWKQQAEQLGFNFHTIDGERYWDESAYYQLSLRQVEDHIETATEAVHDMALELVDEVVDSEELLSKLAIPQNYWDWIRASWKRRDPHLYGRMDFAYDGTGPAKLYELNYDTPTSLYEAGYFQWLWLEQQIAAGQLPAGANQFNSIQERLLEALATLAREGLIHKNMHFGSVRESDEDRATVQYLRDCAHQVGINTAYVTIEDIGISADGWFTDSHDNVIRTLFKLYPLEDMMREQYGPNLTADTMQLLEPAWKAVLSNKGILPMLWDRHKGHPNLLPAHFCDSAADTPAGMVRKPLLSREGANIQIVTGSGEVISSDGPYNDGPAVMQAYHPLPNFDGNYPLVGSWVVADVAAGIGIREDSSLITQNTSRFLPHVFVD